MKLGDFGHWTILETEYTKDGVDLNNYIGFVYVMTFDDGTKYVGAKKIWQRIKKAPCTFKRGPHKGFSQSEWKKYTSSSQTVHDKIMSGQKPTEYLIIGFYDTWGKTLMAEMLVQVYANIFVGDMWLNHRIDGTFLSSCYDETVEKNTRKYLAHLEDPESNKKFKYSLKLDLEKDGKTSKVSVLDKIAYEDAIKLIVGTIDEVDGYILPLNIRRRTWAFIADGKPYKNKTEYTKEKGISSKEFDALGFTINKPETRKEFKERLKKELIIKDMKEYV